MGFFGGNKFDVKGKVGLMSYSSGVYADGFVDGSFNGCFGGDGEECWDSTSCQRRECSYCLTQCQ